MARANTPLTSMQPMTVGQYKAMDTIVGKKLPTDKDIPSGFAQWLIDGYLDYGMGKFLRDARIKWRELLGLRYETSVGYDRVEDATAKDLLMPGPSSPIESLYFRSAIKVLYSFIGTEDPSEKARNSAEAFLKIYFQNENKPWGERRVYQYRATDSVYLSALLECMGSLRNIHLQYFTPTDIVSIAFAKCLQPGAYFFLVQGGERGKTTLAALQCEGRPENPGPQKFSLICWDLEDFTEEERAGPCLRSDQRLMLRKRFDVPDEF